MPPTTSGPHPLGKVLSGWGRHHGQTKCRDGDSGDAQCVWCVSLGEDSVCLVHAWLAVPSGQRLHVPQAADSLWLPLIEWALPQYEPAALWGEDSVCRFSSCVRVSGSTCRRQTPLAGRWTLDQTRIHNSPDETMIAHLHNMANPYPTPSPTHCPPRAPRPTTAGHTKNIATRHRSYNTVINQPFMEFRRWCMCLKRQGQPLEIGRVCNLERGGGGQVARYCWAKSFPPLLLPRPVRLPWRTGHKGTKIVRSERLSLWHSAWSLIPAAPDSACVCVCVCVGGWVGGWVWVGVGGCACTRTHLPWSTQL